MSSVRAEAQTLVDLLRYRSDVQPDQLAYSFLADGEVETQRLTFGELDRDARAIAAGLQDRGLAGERALLLYLSGLDFIAGFFGCLYAGVIAVPAYPPHPKHPSPRLDAIAKSAAPQIILTTQEVGQQSQLAFKRSPSLAALPRHATDAVRDASVLEVRAAAWQMPNLSGEHLAFLQYTSGSTGMPKGAMISHRNILCNERMMEKTLENNEDTVCVSWLPMFHDFGLIGPVLQMLYLGVPSYLMPPVTVLQKPIRWLRAISAYGATTSGSPNFGYDLCVQKISSEQCEGDGNRLDLSRWQTAVNAAEPIRAHTLQRFSEAFKAYGFRREAFYPCYGLAEGTLFVTGIDCLQASELAHVDKEALRADRIETAPEGKAQTFVSCGRSRLGTQLAIVDPASATRCAAETVGEIWVSGPSVAQGYWRQAKATAETFDAHLTDTGEGPFLRTGDLGFVRDGELFVTGRCKELLILRGRNHYPHDLELTASQSHPALASMSGAAFTIEVQDGGLEEERLVLVHEVQRTHIRSLDADEVATHIRRAIAREHDLFIHAIALVKPLSIPKTSSGKIQRYLCREDFLHDRLKAFHVFGGASTTEPQPVSEGPPATIESMRPWLIMWLGHKLHLPIDAIDPARSLADYGLDSLIVIDLHNAIEATFHIDLPIETFFEDITLDNLAARCVEPTADTSVRPAKAEPVSPWETYRQLRYGSAMPPQTEQMSFAQPHDPQWKRWLISMAEWLAGVPQIEQMFEQTLATRNQQATLWEAGLAQLQVRLDYDSRPLGRVPSSGGVVFIANHAYGIVDALALFHLAEATRGPFYAMVGTQLAFATAATPYFLPVPFANTPAAWKVKGQTIQRVLETLHEGGTIVIFPAGMIATSEGWFGPAVDMDWSHFTAHIVKSTDATVVPVYFFGHNSRFFQVVSHLSMTVRRSLFFRETLNQKGSTLRLRIGEPIPYHQMAHLEDERELTAHLRWATHALSYTFSEHKVKFKKMAS